jgi:hypothetical protein
MGTNRDLFCRTLLQKCGRVNNCSLDYIRLVSRTFEEFHHPAIQPKIMQHFARFFPSNKSAPANKEKDTIQTVIRISKFHFCIKRLKILRSLQIFKTEIKTSKTYSSWRPFQGLFKGTTLMQIQSGWTVPLKRLMHVFFYIIVFRV